MAIIVVGVAVVAVVGGLFAFGILRPGGSQKSGGGAKQYAVTFIETGLPTATSWSVTFGGTTLTSTTSTIVFDRSNGTYAFTVAAVSRYRAAPSSGSTTVSGATVTVPVSFAISVASIPVGIQPDAVAFDSADGYLYVVNEAPSNVSVIDGATGASVGSISTGPGSFPAGVAYDSANQNVYVTGYDSNNLTVIDATTDKSVMSVPTCWWPGAVVFDPANGYLYIANYSSSGDIGVVNGATNTLIGTVPSGIAPGWAVWPSALAYDSFNGYIYVTITGMNRVTVISGATDRVVDVITVGDGPDGVAYDTANGYVYVADGYMAEGNNVTVINGATDKVVGSIPVGQWPDAVAYDSANGFLFVANEDSHNVSEINGSTDTVIRSVPVGTGPDAATYDPANGYVYVANYNSDNLTVVNGTVTGSTGSVPAFETHGAPTEVGADQGILVESSFSGAGSIGSAGMGGPSLSVVSTVAPTSAEGHVAMVAIVATASDVLFPPIPEKIG